MNNPHFGRLITAMVTPFTPQGEVDYPEAIKVAHYLVDTGTDTVLLAGTTGESPTMSHEEEYKLFEVIVKALKGRAYVMAGTGSNCTATAIEASKIAQELGADALLQVVPYYNKPSQEGMFQHFNAVAQAVSIPILLYNIPGRTGKNMEPETMARVSSLPNIIGVKESAGSVDQVAQIRACTPSDFLIYSGDDGLILPFMEKGACGVVSVASHCAGLRIKAMMQAFLDERKEEAYAIEAELKSLFEVLFINTNPAPVKSALSLMGFSMGGLRLPLVEVTTEEYRQIKDVLASLSII